MEPNENENPNDSSESFVVSFQALASKDTSILNINNYLNPPDVEGVASLHRAIREDDKELLESLLSSSNIDVNCKTYKGETPLFLSLCSFRDDAFILRLLESGCDPNISNNYRQVPLHMALLRSTTDVAHQLIKRGADLNAQDKSRRTPLYYAVDNANLEGVCMLLYYGADVSIVCEENMTPFTFALYMNRLEIAQELFPFYCDFDATDSDGYTALHLAVGSSNSLAIDLVKAGADVNAVTNYGDSALAFSLKDASAELFKLIWSKLDCSILLNCERPFLLTFIETLCFSAAEWLECLYLILKSPVAFSLVEHYHDYMDRSYIPGIFFVLLYNFYYFNIELVDRMAVINLCLYLRAVVNLQDLDRALEFFGFNEELETFLYVINRHYNQACDPLNRFSLPMLNFILVMEDDEVEEILDSVYNVLESDITEGNRQNIMNVLGYFAIPRDKKQYLQNLWESTHGSDNYISAKFNQIPVMPSLLELSRNKARIFIKESYKVSKPYQFQDAVKNMNLPERLKNIIRFKIPIY